MKIAFISSECVPFASTGGLGDVTSSLPLALQAEGHQVCRILPLYRAVRDRHTGLEPVGQPLIIPVGYEERTAEVYLSRDDGIETYFINREEYFDRSQLYGLPHRDYDDSFERFVFFQKAAVAWLDQLGFGADIVHTNDWQTGLVGFYLRWGLQGEGREQTERTVFTIHNVAYQGIFPASEFTLTGLPYACLDVDSGLEYYGQLSCLKAGIVSADRVTTVSPTYAGEIRTDEGGRGLGGLLTSMANRFTGVLNGIDDGAWDPSNDGQLKRTYDLDSVVAGKAACKKALQTKIGLPVDAAAPIFGMITRLTQQKGLDLVAEIMPDLVQRGAQVVLLGSGETAYHDLCRTWLDRWPDQVACEFEFNIGLSHQIYGGCDFLLVPSVFEPCGLNQLYAMRYGSIPVVHRTGGLADTVIDQRDDPESGTGYSFSPYDRESFLAAIDAGLVCRNDDPDGFAAMQRLGMQRNSSWQRSAAQYVALYDQLLD